MLALGFALLLQAQPLDVSVSLDRSRVAVGEEFVFTLRAIGHSTAPFRVELPAFDGLALVARSERTDVVVGTTQTTRAFTLELRLRAEQVGSWTVPAIRVEQGTASAFATPQSVTVTSGSSAPGGLDPDLLALIARAPPPRPGVPSVFTIASAGKVFLGDQLNVLTGAWLPRGLRLRMRQAPTLTPPSLASVWVTPRRAVTGAVATRSVEGESYDLYVSFQTAYPLDPGLLTIPPARLSWVPPSRQYLSPEQRESVESASLRLTVEPLPDAGRPAGFGGPVARELRVEYELGSSSARAAAALPVTVVVSGSGNLPLWPVPQLAWPAGVRVYQEATADAPRPGGGAARLGGSKRFRFSLIPDSAGSLSLPPLDYPYFDPQAASYRVAHAAPIVVPVLEAAPVAQQRNPLPLEVPDALTLGERFFRLPRLALLSLVGVPLLALSGVLLLGRRQPRRAPPVPRPEPASRFEALLGTLVPPGTPAAPEPLTRALRAAGLDRPAAEDLVRLHLALEAERFGPEAARPTGTPPGELEAALARLPRPIRRWSGTALLAILAAALAVAAPLRAQRSVGSYTQGDYVAAARAFRQEAAVRPPGAARWYDLAASEYLANRDAAAVAALLPARARAPRDRYVQALWNALAREHEQLRRAGNRMPVSAEECGALAVIALWAGVALFALLSRRRELAIVLLGVSLALALLALELRSDRAIPRAVLAGGATLRTSPHGLAPERGAVPAFSVVMLERRSGGWWLVHTSDGALGWVPAEILERSPPLD